jgi:hypothetical protein
MASVRRLSIFVLGSATAALLLNGEAIAADSTKWLIENPVSMMDWGSEKAKESAQHAADLLNTLMEGRAKQDSDFEYDKSIPEEVKTKTIEERKQWAKVSPQQYGYHYGPGFAGYDLPRDRILVGVFVVPDTSLHPGKIDAESCAGIIDDFRKQLLEFAKSPQQLAADIWFTHNGYKLNAIPTNFEKDLTAHITVIVHLNRFVAMESTLTCEQPLLGGAITSIIKKQSD